MESLPLLIVIGVVLSISTFLFFENMAIKAKKQSIEEGEVVVKDCDLGESFIRYDTSKNVAYFFASSYVISLGVAIAGYSPEYGLVEALLYIFVTTFIGSSIIFVLKFKRSLLITVFATFLYGVPLIGASVLAFLTKYLFS
ncbi:MAG: hypothetical protein ACI9RG_000980 [Sulfurimonas sp.]|jgi:hypothetical protein|uniref:hypothetical protein n=1 Tax=Sulfurimonas sp. TaxID=2022749 RepID=UPI0025D8DD8D|nr:hypothetical protein [Sulfurimonas sp.]